MTSQESQLLLATDETVALAASLLVHMPGVPSHSDATSLRLIFDRWIMLSPTPQLEFLAIRCKQFLRESCWGRHRHLTWLQNELDRFFSFILKELTTHSLTCQTCCVCSCLIKYTLRKYSPGRSNKSHVWLSGDGRSCVEWLRSWARGSAAWIPMLDLPLVRQVNEISLSLN